MFEGDFSLLAPTFGEPLTIKLVALSLILAIVLSQAVATVYVWTFRGMSYSRSFVHATCLGSIVACMLMLAINNSIAAGLGIAGSLAFIRFRTAMRDPKDMVFLFAALGAGIASGLRAHGAAMVGTALFCAMVFVLTYTEFGRRQHFDGVLRVNLPQGGEHALPALLGKEVKRFALVSAREVAQGERMEYVYQIELRNARRHNEILRLTETLPGATDVSLLMQEATISL